MLHQKLVQNNKIWSVHAGGQKFHNEVSHPLFCVCAFAVLVIHVTKQCKMCVCSLLIWYGRAPVNVSKKIWILMPTLQSSMHVPSSRSCNLPISLSHGTFLHLHIQEQASKIPSLQSQSHKQRISKHHTWETRRTNYPSQEACPLGEEMEKD